MLKMLSNALLCAVVFWATATGGATFQFPNTNTGQASNPTENVTSNNNFDALARRRTIAAAAGNTRPTNIDQINFMDDYGDHVYESRFGNNLQENEISRGLFHMTVGLDRAVTPSGKTLVPSGDNVVFSPTCIAVTLALVMLGAGGQTLAEVTRVMGLRDAGPQGNDAVHRQISATLASLSGTQGGNAQPTATTTIATGVFLQQDYPVKEKFLRTSKDVYKSDVIPLDFVGNSAHAGDTVNRWVEWRTQGRIKGFLSSPPEPSTKVLLASALYFNGKWEKPFPITNTRRRPFYSPGPNGTDELLEVTMMVAAVDVPYYSDPTLGCRFVTLPYQGGQMAMHFVLPNARGYAELLRLKNRITLAALEAMIANSGVVSTIVSLPRMKLESSFSLRTALEAMGLRSLFDPNLSNLSNLSSGIINKNTSNDFFTFSTRQGAGNAGDVTPGYQNGPSAKGQQARRGSSQEVLQSRQSDLNPGLYADDVYHKVEVEITETGTVGSAVTATSISRDGSRPTVRMDRPFLFFVRDNVSKMILFWGTVLRPT